MEVTNLGHGPWWSPIDPVQVSMFHWCLVLLIYKPRLYLFLHVFSMWECKSIKTKLKPSKTKGLCLFFFLDRLWGWRGLFVGIGGLYFQPLQIPSFAPSVFTVVFGPTTTQTDLSEPLTFQYIADSKKMAQGSNFVFTPKINLAQISSSSN